MINYDGKQNIVVGVSGGVDSMVLLDKLINKYGSSRLIVVTVNHNLRATSATDCDFVEQFCVARKVKCFVSSIEVATYADINKLSLETSARILRHNEFNRYAKEFNAVIATAHHIDDNVESVLMHIFRGCGVNGLVGITQYGNYIRPLLDEDKSSILKYANEHNIPFVNDETNADSAYTRNFIRNEVIPLVNSRFSVNSSLTSLSNNAVAVQNFINKSTPFELVTFDGAGCANIELNDLDDVIKANLIVYALNGIGKFTDIYSVHISDICSLFHKKVASSIDIGDGYVAVRNYQAVVLRTSKEISTKKLNIEVPISYVTSEIVIGNDTIKLTASPTAKYTKGVLNIDINKLPEGCVIRHRREGDMFSKYGLKGTNTTKLTQYLIEVKIEQAKRDELYVLALGNIVYAVVGLQISQLVKVDADSNNILQIEKFTKE